MSKAAKNPKAGNECEAEAKTWFLETITSADCEDTVNSLLMGLDDSVLNVRRRFMALAQKGSANVGGQH